MTTAPPAPLIGDRGIWRPAPEPALVPYRPLSLHGLGTLIVLAPHPDDDVFGCGGLLALAAQAGVSVHVVVVSGGDQAGVPAEREAESRHAADTLGYGSANAAASLQFWGLPDRHVAPDTALVRRIGRLLADSPEPAAGHSAWLLAPSPFEVHPDHRATCLAAIEAFGARLPAPTAAAWRLGFYEVGQPLVPNALIDITPVLERKRAALACFASQMALQRYDEQILALNRYRAYTLGPAVTHAEALWFPDPVDCASADAVLQGLQRLLCRRLAASADEAGCRRPA